MRFFYTLVTICTIMGHSFGDDLNQSLSTDLSEMKEDAALTVATFVILNKISAKRNIVHIPIGQSLVINDIQIIPECCIHQKDAYKGDIYHVPTKIYLEQNEQPENEGAEPIELYNGTLSSNPRESQIPLEHAVYDIILKECS